jgi:putative flippase GtrA
MRVRTLLKSALVGGVATLVDLCAMSLFVYGAGILPRVASPFSLALGLACQFVGNKVFAFEDRSRAWGRQAALFLMVEALGFAANVALFDFAVRFSPLPLLVTRMGAQALVYFGLCLPAWSLIFKAPEAARPEAS